MPIVADERQSRLNSFWTPLRLALFFWVSMVAATAIPLLLVVGRSWLAMTTVSVAIVVGAVLFSFIRAEAELRAELARTADLTRDNVPVASSEPQ
jgi:hypothetical protein